MSPAEGRTGTYITVSGGGGAGSVVSAISASNATFTGTVRITGGPNITVGTDASGITMSAAAGGGGGGIALAGSNTTFTSGTVVLSGSNAATIKSNAGGLVVDVPTQTAQTQNLHNLTLSGNTAGVMAQVSSGTVTLAGGNNVTISQAGNAITISGANTHAQQTGISSVAASNTTYTSGGITFTGSNMVTVRSTTGQGIVIDATQTVQPGVQAISAGTQTATTGTVVFSNANNVTFGISSGASTSILTASASFPAQTAQTGISSIGASNTTYTSGGVTFTGSNIVTVRSTTGQGIVIDASTSQSVQTQNLHNLTLSGNTAGVMAQISSGTLTLAGGANITLSQAGNAVTISGGGAGGAFSAGASNLGNTAGSTGVTGTRLVFVGSNNVTLSQSTDANGGTVSINAAGGGAGQYSMGVSTGGNTAGDTGLTGTQGVLVGSSGITLSQTTGANGGTVTIQGPGAWAIPNVSFYDNLGGMVGSATSQWRNPATAQKTWFFFPLTPPNDYFPGQMTPASIRMDISGSNTVSTTSTAAFSLSVSLAIYTRNGSSLSIVNSATTSIGSAANASISSWYHGFRWLTWHSSQFSSQPVFTQTQYWAALAFSSAGEAKLLSMLGGQFAAVGSANRSGFLGVGSSTGSSTMLEHPFLGMYTVTSGSPPGSVSKGQIAHANNTNSVNFIPHIVMDNLGVLD